MTDVVVLSFARSYPADVAIAFDALLAVDLTGVFSRRYAAIPPIREVRDQDGAWGTAGQTRTIALADGGSMREELLEVSRPERFTYRIGAITGPMRPLVSAVEGAWLLEPAGTGVRVTWTWAVQPAGRPGRLAMPVFRWMWQGYARRAFDRIETLLVP